MSVVASPTVSDPGDFTSATASCPSGSVATGGGFSVSPLRTTGNGDLHYVVNFNNSTPTSGTPNAWTAGITTNNGNGGTNLTLTVSANCAQLV